MACIQRGIHGTLIFQFLFVPVALLAPGNYTSRVTGCVVWGNNHGSSKWGVLQQGGQRAQSHPSFLGPQYCSSDKRTSMVLPPNRHHNPRNVLAEAGKACKNREECVETLGTFHEHIISYISPQLIGFNLLHLI